ncbi:hypothetical protein [Paenisporosarcina sp. NPDC076898]|uniref:hypothetical protein n=1 Tax=unclassified Paenisporosarcina TaxID=2642018 RepID=UPI003CFFF926
MTKQTNQIYLYSVTTKAFYNEQEQMKQQEIYDLQMKGESDTTKRINELKDELNQLMIQDLRVRELNASALNQSTTIAQFESSLTRALELDSNSNIPSQDIMIVQVYHYAIMDSLISNGFKHNGEHYRYMFSSAGQIRTKKLVFIKESCFKQIENKLTAGLTDSIINDNGGISINKLIAYKALANSSSVKWDIDLNKAIVVDDFEFTIKDKTVDFIGSDYEVNRKVADISNQVVDGAGLMLPSVIDKNIQFRGVWFKGLLTPFDFIKFINEHEVASPIVKDVWGTEHNIVEDDIQIIFTKSQFKMAKYFKSWDEYKTDFNEYGCEFSICDIEGDVFEDKTLNYQMLQTLYDMSHEDLVEITSHTKETIENATSSTQNMIEFIGATKDKKYKQPWHEALLLHPELINDAYFKKMVKDKKASMIKDARSGKIVIPNTKRTFLIPDCYAFCQWLFGLKVTGLLEDGQVSCQLYEDGKELDVLRSPHLYIEHCVRQNLVNEKVKRWFTTNGVYTSVRDAISTQLMFDVDGDTALIIDNETFVKNAKAHMIDVVPLQFDLGVAEASEINGNNITKSLKSAYSKNIGEVSNKITKVFNQDVITEDDLKMVKQLCYINNQYIDYAKTLWIAQVPLELSNKLKKLDSVKLPTFFIQAKDKKRKQVTERNNSTVNRLYDVMQTKRLMFDNQDFDYKVLMNNANVKVDDVIVKKYKELTATRYFKMQTQLELQGDTPARLFAIQVLRKELLELNEDINYVVDVLIKHLHGSEYSKFMWDCFGAEILWNMKSNLGKLKRCECTEEFEPASNRQVKCTDCAEKAKKEAARLRKQKSREKKVS